MLYSYTAIARDGKSAVGELEAGSERELADKLRHEGLILLEARAPGVPRAQAWSGRLESFTALARRVSLVDRMVFARNLAVMIGAGLPLVRSLETLEAQTSNPRLQAIIRGVRDGVLKGRSLAESLKPHERTFGPLFVNMVESGELSGNLEKVLKLLARQMRKDHDLRSKVRGALIYPAIIVVALVAVGALMMIYVVPTLTQTFRELEIALPVTTRLIIAVSELLLHYGIWVLAGAVLLGALAWRAVQTPFGRSFFHAAMLRLPILGPLLEEFNSALFSRTLASLISSGIPIVKSLEVTAGVLGNIHFRNAVLQAASSIQQGRKLGEILAERPDLFPPVVTQMVSVGEETGTLSRMLLRLALFYEDEVATVTKNLSSVIEPILMIVIGAIVGFFAVSMIQPIYSGLGNL